MQTKPPSVVAIYPGSFDPITNGHLDLIERGARLFDRLIVAILRNEAKQPLFSRRRAHGDAARGGRRATRTWRWIPSTACWWNTPRRAGATVILRGIRAISDYEYELQMALMNRRLQPGIETVFLMAGEAYSFISSRLVKEVFGLGGNIAGLVPPSVEARLRGRLTQAAPIQT